MCLLWSRYVVLVDWRERESHETRLNKKKAPKADSLERNVLAFPRDPEHPFDFEHYIPYIIKQQELPLVLHTISETHLRSPYVYIYRYTE